MAHITILTCTKDRPKEIKNLLDSIRDQSRKPDLHIIVDGSDNPKPVKDIVDNYSDISIQYYSLRPPGLTRQKNFGISKLPPNTDLVAIMDDDIVLSKNLLCDVEDYLDKNNMVMGLGCIFTNIEARKKNFVRNIFLLDSNKDGDFTNSGVPVSIHKKRQVTDTKWLHGGATFWRSSILKEYKFDEWYSGVGYLEDIDFSYTVSKKNKLIFYNKAACQVVENPTPLNKMAKLGCWQIAAWWYFVSKNKEFSKLAAIYSMLNLAIINLITGLFKPNNGRFYSFIGNLKGLSLICFNKVNSHKGFQK